MNQLLGNPKGKILMQFIECIQVAGNDVFNQNPQGVFCPGGTNKKVSWT
jgi:hypothetical protein